jgi:hypothetical protein
MFNRALSGCLRWLGGPPCLQVYGKARWELTWRIVGLHATHRRDRDSTWPAWGWRGTCTTWTSTVVAAGWDFAIDLVREQLACPASRDHPVTVAGGRMGDPNRRLAAGASAYPCVSEIMAHELGHTGQALRMGGIYLPVVGALTLFREGPRWWSHFENDASEQGQLGGIVDGSISQELQSRIDNALR